MRGVGGPLLCIGDLLSDVGESDGGDILENSSLLSASTSSIPNPKDPFPAVDKNQLFERSWASPKNKPHSHSLEHHDDDKKSSPSSNTISVLDEDVSMCNNDVHFDRNFEVVMDVGDGGAKKMIFKRALPDDEMCCPSPPKVDRANASENQGSEDVEEVVVENCAPGPHLEDEVIPRKEDGVEEDEGIPPNELPCQALQSLPLEKDKDVIAGGLQHIRIDCSSHFITDKEFRTKEEVLHWAKLQGRQTGTVLMINKSQEAYRGRAPRLCLGCDRGGKYDIRRPPKGLRKTGTKKCACPFKLGTTWTRVGEKEWKIKVYVKNGVHNHQLAKFTGRHTYAGKLTKVELDIVAGMAKAGAKPKEIILALQKNDPGNCTSLRQIYNAIQTFRSKGMGGKSRTQHLPKKLNDNRCADFNHDLELAMDVADGSAKKLNFETTSPNDDICCRSPPNVDRVNSTEKKGREDMDNVNVENYIPDPPVEDECIPPKEDEAREVECIPLNEQSQATQISQSFPNVDVENCVLDTRMEDEVIFTNEDEGILPNERQSQITQESQSLLKGREEVDNVVVDNFIPDTPMEDEGILPNEQQLLTTEAPQSPLEKDEEDIRLDCSSLFKTDKEFRTKEEVLNWAKLLGRQTGTVLMISKSQAPHHGRAPRLYLACERGGKYGRRPTKGLRKTGTKKCACPFELGTTWTRVGEKEWKIKVYVRNGIHNHRLGQFTEGHSSAGKLTKKELDIVADLTKARVRPREIIHALRKNDPGNCTSLTQLYNAVRAIKLQGGVI